MALGSFPLGVPKEKSPGGFVSPAGSETPGVRPSVLSAQGPQLESLSSGRPCRTPTGKGQGQRRWEAWHATPPRGVHCTENSSVKGPVTPNLCIPCDQCRALSWLPAPSPRASVAATPARCPAARRGPSRGKRAPVTHVVPLLRTAAQSPAAGGAAQRGWRPRQKEGGARGAGGVPSGEDPFPQGKADDLAGEDQEGPGRFSWASLALWASSTGHATWGLWLSL